MSTQSSVLSPQSSVMEMRDVWWKTGEKTIVRELNFEVKEGEIFAFIGPSGSGKTTTIRLLMGIFRPTQGAVQVMGVSPDHPSRRVQERLGYMPQLFVLYPNLSVMENLNFAASLYGLGFFKRRRRIKELLEFVELWGSRHSLAGKISGGMQRRLQLAASLLHDPPLLFADEPTAGIDPVLRGKFWEEFRRLRDEGRTLFVTTQYVGESEYCDRVAVIRRGRIIAIAPPIVLRRMAFGGDVVDISASNLTPAAVQRLIELDIVKDVRPVSRTEVRAFVEDAGVAIPTLMEELGAIQCDVQRLEEYRPSFDEVFIELMEKDARERGETKDDGQ